MRAKTLMDLLRMVISTSFAAVNVILFFIQLFIQLRDGALLERREIDRAWLE